jgi:integrase/recombinase XerD
LRHLLRCLRSAGLVAAQSKAGKRVFVRVIAEYDQHLQSTCGLADATRLYRRRYAREFLGFVFGEQRICWRRVTPRHVRSYIATFAKDGRVAAARVAADSLRSFFRWLQLRGLIDSNLIGAVPGFPIWRWGSLPAVMTDAQLRDFLAVFNQSRPSGCRDYAMALCMVVLGLRVAEVADLMLTDLDTTAGTLRLAAGKSRRVRVLPMPQNLQQAVLNYLRRHRPKTADPHVFVRHRAPAGVAVSRELVRGAMRRAYAVVDGCQSWTGTHVLRHTAATRLHSAGADLKRVADILGHASINTTAIYAKVDLNRLRQVALPWPGTTEVQP